MEKTDSKLNYTNPILTAQVFSRLVESAVEKNSAKQELAYLKIKCLGENSPISDAARVSILKLIENDILQIDQVLADFITSISTASNLTSLVKIITSLLYLQLCQKAANKDHLKIKPLQLLQHPIVKILQGECNCEVQMCIYNEVMQFSYQNPNLSLSANTLYEPVYLYCICSPLVKMELSLLRHKLWASLIQYDKDNNTSFIYKLCCWMQLENKHSDLAGSLLDEVFQRQLVEHLKNIDYMILIQILVIYNMVVNNSDCRLTIKRLLLLLPKITFCHHNVSILILSRAVMVCSPLCLEELLQLCYYFVNHNSCQPYSFLALKSVLLHWLSGPCLLTQGALKIAGDILKLNDHVCREKPLILASRLNIDKFHYLTFCNPEIFLTLQLGIKFECTRDEDISSFLESFEEAPVHYLNNCFTFLCGLLLYKKLNADDKLAVLRLIVKCSSQYIDFLPTVLTLLLYQLSNSKDNRLHFELLKALPPMVKVKENVPKVIATIQAISKHSSALNTFALRLMYAAWEIENKCYSALETIALQSPARKYKEEIFEQNVSKAYIFKLLSEKRPELYGKDLVAYLSKILNSCTTSDGSVPSALAIEGIRHLCKAEIIDIVTTWATLSPKFKDETRVPVVKSLCQLVSEIPHLQYTQSYERLNDEVVQHLWNYVVTSDDEEVMNAAFDALANFNLDLMCMHFPAVYLDESSVKQNPVGDRIIPGKTWLKFLTTYKSRAAARNFIIKLVAVEIDNYLKYVYQVKSHREPENYGTLPTHSIVRALGEYIKHNCQKVKSWGNTSDEDLFINCLKILSVTYSKPLPPLDWCFLQELVHIPSMKQYCLDLASRQAILSGSARRLMENFIVAITENPLYAESIHVYRNLRHLANSIQPMILKPFLENSLFSAIDQDHEFQKLINYSKEVLEDNNVQDMNKYVIEEIVTKMVFVTDVSSKIFPVLLDGTASFSQQGQEKICRFNSLKIGEDEFIKVTKVRCHISKHTQSEAPLMWLNDIFCIACRNNVKLDIYFEDVASTLKTHIDHEESPTWLVELFGEIQAKVADRCDKTQIGYFCDILAIAVVYFSGFFVILPKYGYDSIKYFFPAALTFLMYEPKWSVCTTQILEWLHHMNTAESVPEEYQHVFGWTLCSLRHEEEFSKSSRWMKYLDCEIYTDNIL